VSAKRNKQSRPRYSKVQVSGLSFKRTILKKRILILPVMIGAGLWLASDDSPHKFCTQAVYEAPQMGFRIKVLGAGVVEPGDDLSNGYRAIAVICPTAGTASPIRLIRTGLNTGEYSLTDGGSDVLDWDFRSKSKVLAKMFRSAGFGSPSDDEIAETMHVFENVSYGIKGTTMPSQTKFLTGISVDFSLDKCEGQAPQEWVQQNSLTLDCST